MTTSKESGTIICYERGSDQLPWTGPLTFVAEDLEFLKRLAEGRILTIAVHGEQIEIAGTDRVGLILLPSGKRICIRSKVDSLVLLDWLVLVGEFPNIQHWVQEQGLSLGDDLPECIAKLFLLELERVTRHYLRRDYTSVISSSVSIRGRIQTSQLSRQLHRLPQLPMKYRTQTFDTPANIVLALALDRLPSLLSMKSLEDIRRLSRLQDEWSGITREAVTPAVLITETQWALPPGYASALQLARLILTGAGLTDGTGQGGQVFTISMASIWEKGIRSILESLSATTGWMVSPSPARTRPWDDSANVHDPNRWLTVDVLLSHGSERWALDTKYKRGYGHEHRTDRFQMCAYALAFEASKGTLVYPTSQESGQRRTLLQTNMGGMEITIDSIDLPMWLGPAECRKVLASLSRHSPENSTQ